MSLIAITEVKKRFGDNEVLKGINLDVDRGEVIAIIGKSGSGKSTLLRCVNGLETIDEGSILVAGAQLLPNDVHLKALRLKVGMIFQQFNLFPHHTAGGNVMLAQMVVKGMPRVEAEAIARKMLDRVGLGHKFDAYPDQLSGASSSGSRSPAPSRCSRSRCCAMRSRRRSIPNSSTRCLRSSGNSSQTG